MQEATAMPSGDSTSHVDLDTLPSIRHLKQAARLLQRHAREGRREALRSLRQVAVLRSLDENQLVATLQRRHCLTALAQRLGFQGWSHLIAVLNGQERTDFGKLLYPPSASYWNIWSANYDEARRIRQDHGGYLLPYQRQFIVADQYFIEALGMDPDDHDWRLMGRDWVTPEDTAARRRLYDRVIRHRLVNG